jgi:hypothetical protein
VGRYCEETLSPLFAHIWVLGFDAVGVTIAMYCLIQFYIQLKEDLASNRPFLKICCIKLVIFFSFWQNVCCPSKCLTKHSTDNYCLQLLISFLSSGTKPVITTGPRVSYVDVKVGIPSVLLCMEMALFSILHIFAFPWKCYDISESSNPNDHYQGGFFGLKAVLDAFNPMDFIRATARGFKWLFVGVRHREEDESYKNIQRQPGTLASGAKISGPYPISPSEADEDFKARHAETSGESIELMTGHQPLSLQLQPKRQATDEFSDHTALLSGAQRMPVSPSASGGLPMIDRSVSSTPPSYLNAQAISPGLSPMQLRDPISRIDSPPSPMDERMLGNGGNGGSMDARVGRGGRDLRGPQMMPPSSGMPGQAGGEYGRRDNRSDGPPGPQHGFGQAF